MFFLKNYKHKGGFLVSKLNKLNNPEYVLLPIWFVNTNYNNKKYSYAVNAQTGKVVGEIPLSPIKFRSLMAILIIIASLLTIGYFRITNETAAMKHGIGYVAKDRDLESLALNTSIRDNIAVAGMERYALGNFLVTNGREKPYVDEQIRSLSIKCAGRDQLVSQLSGGNKQKVVFGKWIGRGSEILILDCPTRGVDIGVKKAMYELMTSLKNEGKAIIMISEELPELMGMADRLIIMKDGVIMKEFARSASLSDAEIIQYMI